MSGPRFAPWKTRHWLPILLGIRGLTAQTCLVLSPATTDADGAVSMDLSLYSSSAESPAAVQWTFQSPASSITSLTVDDGPILISAGKTTICAGAVSTHNCLAVGANTTTIPNGVIAKVTAVLAPGANTATLRIVNPLGSSILGYVMPILSRALPGGGAYVTYDCRPHPPPRGTLGRK